MATSLAPFSSKREACLHSGEDWKLLCHMFLTCALAKTPEIYHKRAYLLTTVLVKEPELQAGLDRASLPQICNRKANYLEGCLFAHALLISGHCHTNWLLVRQPSGGGSVEQLF